MTDIREAVARALFFYEENEASWFDHPAFIGQRELACQRADVALSAIETAGYAVVPKEPDDAMVWAACAAHDFPSVYMGGPRLGWAPTAKRVYRSMLEAAASPPLAKET